MATAIEYALMAGASYVSSRPDLNKIPGPAGWVEAVDDRQKKPSGFEATYFTKGTEVVIAFAGTQPGAADWIYGNIPLANGALSDQLRQAADYYLLIKASVPEGTKITLTGHSLGGGLASLIAVFFGESAFTFDQAPFRNSAQFYEDDPLLHTTRSAAKDLKDYLSGRGATVDMLAPLQAYIDANEFFAADPNPADTLAGREAWVTDINVQGEVLTKYLGYSRIGTEADIPNNTTGVSSIDLHSQTLLVAYLQSNQTADSFKGFSDATFKRPDLLKMIFDPKLFAYQTTDPENENFLERLVKHETGVRDPLTGAVTTPDDAMVTRFTSDLWKLAQDGGLTMSDGNTTNADLHEVSNALIAFAMQKYYEEKGTSAGYNKELFKAVTGGLQFDMADVSKTFKTAFDSHDKLNLDDAKGYKEYFKHYLEQDAVFTAEERGLINEILPWLRDWYVQAGADGLNVTDSLNRGAFLLGGKGSDALVGGSSADLLVGGAQYGDTRVHRDADKRLYVQVDAKTLIIDGNIIVKNYTAGETILGLNMSGAVADTDPVTTLTITGDIRPTDIDPEESGIQADGNDYDNPLGTAQPYEDILGGSSGNDHILSGERNDDISGEGGDDWIEGGSGNDYIGGRSGEDLIEGGAGSDILVGEADNDRIYANTRISTATAIANGNNDADSGQKGDWLSGNAGDDILVAGADNDVLIKAANDASFKNYCKGRAA